MDTSNLLAGGVLGDGLGAFGDGVLGEFSREDQADGGLDLAGAQGALLVVAAQLAGLRGGLLEDVVDEGVHDRHGAARDASVRVHLLQHLVDVGGVRLNACLSALGLVARGLGLADGLGLASACFAFSSSFSGHVERDEVQY